MADLLANILAACILLLLFAGGVAAIGVLLLRTLLRETHRG